MEPSVVETVAQAAKPPRWWIILIAAAGATGSLGAVGVAGTGTYDVAPFKIRLEAGPAPAGKTVLQVQPVEDLITVPLRAEAGTHASPVQATATIVGVTAPVVSGDRDVLTDPFEFASLMGDDGKSAVRSFAIKLGGLAAGGGGLAGLLLSFGRWRRIAGGALAGLLTFGGIGGLMQQTYDSEEFTKTRFVVVEDVLPGDVLPTDLTDPVDDLLGE